jgi:hypothetical protein
MMMQPPDMAILILIGIDGGLALAEPTFLFSQPWCGPY